MGMCHCVNLLTCFIQQQRAFNHSIKVVLCDISSLCQTESIPQTKKASDHLLFLTLTVTNAQTHTHAQGFLHWHIDRCLSDRVLGLRCWMCDTLAGNLLLYNGECGWETRIALISEHQLYSSLWVMARELTVCLPQEVVCWICELSVLTASRQSKLELCWQWWCAREAACDVLILPAGDTVGHTLSDTPTTCCWLTTTCFLWFSLISDVCILRQLKICIWLI